MERLLRAACLAPSVGLSQPWRFVLVTDPERRAAIRENFLTARLNALRDLKAAADPLYAALSPEQKKTADEVMLSPIGMGIMM